MAFSNTPTKIIDMGNGIIREIGIFDGDSVTTGTITAATATELAALNLPSDRVITEIIGWGFASDGDTAILPAKDVGLNEVKATFTNSDTGDYWIEGFGK
jgi:hypothetical protein